MSERDSISFPPPEERQVAIRDVTVVPMSSPDLLPSQTVIIQGGTITAIGPSAGMPVERARVVDGTGKYLLPGLADMHVHYWDITEFGMFLANGVTLVRNMWGSPFHLALQRKVREGAFPGPRVVTTSPIIDGPGPDGTTIWPGSALAASPEDAGPMVREFAARGYQQTKAYSWLKLDVLKALGQASREASIRMVGHCPDGVTYEEAIDAGMTCFEHLTGIATGRLGGRSLLGLRMGSMEAMRMVVEHLDFDGIRRLAHQLAHDDIWNCPTVVVWQGMSQDLDVALANPLLAYEPATMAAGWNPANDFRLKHTMDSRAEWLAMARARIEVFMRTLAILHEEGAPLLLGTDTPNPYVYQGFAIHDELANLVAAGLSPYEALRTGTAAAARFLGEDREWGTVGVGKRADLLLVAANPLHDVTAVRHPETVFVNGYVFERNDLDDLLEQRMSWVHGDAQPVAIEIRPSTGSGEVVAEGLLTERLEGMNASRRQYRHGRLPDGGWAIDEVTQRGADSLSSSGGKSISHLELSSSLDVRNAEIRTESLVGTESTSIRRVPDGSYAVRHTDCDGFETSSTLAGPLPPSEDLAFTAMPLFLAGIPGGETDRAMLGLDGARAMAVPTHFTPHPDGEWEVCSARRGTTRVQSYRVTPDGLLLGMREQSWQGRLEVLPTEESPGAADATR
jgi:imidazolonepropionase-like amidohydrolase